MRRSSAPAAPVAPLPLFAGRVSEEELATRREDGVMYEHDVDVHNQARRALAAQKWRDKVACRLCDKMLVPPSSVVDQPCSSCRQRTHPIFLACPDGHNWFICTNHRKAFESETAGQG